MTPISYFANHVRSATKTRTQPGWHIIRCDQPKKLDTNTRTVSSFAMRAPAPIQSTETPNRFSCLARNVEDDRHEPLTPDQNKARAQFLKRREQLLAQSTPDTQAPSNQLRLASWNVNGINGKANPDSRNRVEAALQAHNVHICAVQETHIRERNDIHADIYTLHDEPADPNMTSKGGGVGFLVHTEFSEVFTYLGSRHPATAHRLTWARMRRPLGHDHIYIASVYMPDSSYAEANYVLMLEHLADDYAFYSAKSPYVVLIGDFNAKVAAQPETTRHKFEAQNLGPILSYSSVSSASGKLLSSWCTQENAYFLSGRTPHSATPTFTRAAQATSIDHVIGSPGNLAWAQSITVAAKVAILIVATAP